MLNDDGAGADREEAWRVAGRDGVIAARLARGEDFASAFSHPSPQPAERVLDLGPIGSGEEVDGLEIGRHGQPTIVRSSAEQPPGQSNCDPGGAELSRAAEARP